MSETVTITGVIDTVTCDKPDTGWGIRRLKVDEQFRNQPYVSQKGVATIVGQLVGMGVGERVKVKGPVKNHRDFGLQIMVEAVELLQVKGQNEMVRFIAENVKQIGPKHAAAIVEHFGDKTIEIIDNEPDRLLEVKGIGKDRLKNIKKEWEAKKGERDLLLFCTQAGITFNLFKKIKDAYGVLDGIAQIKADPYDLARRVDGIGFIKADEIARHLGMVELSPLRLRAALLHVLREQVQSVGHCFMYEKEMKSVLFEFLQKHTPQVTTQHVEDAVAECLSRGMIVLEQNRFYLPDILQFENAVAKKLAKMITYRLPSWNREQIAEIIAAAKNRVTFKLDPIQVEGIIRSLSCRVAVLTGGPGTGKTTSTQCIVAGWQKAGYSITLLAPTGRAAKRMAEVIGIEASTAHRTLFMLKKHGGSLGGVIVMDETSMVDIPLMNWLLKYVDDDAILIIVGDKDQLPSVGPGAVLRDLIESKEIPTTHLQHIFRQAEGSDIAVSAAAINKGHMPKLNIMSRQSGFPQGTDMFTCLIEDAQEQTNAALWCATQLAPKMGYDPVKDVIVLSPQRKNTSGVDMLNSMLQRQLNPNPKAWVDRGFNMRWGIGDRVMQTKNNYTLGVMNGDVGIIKDLEAYPDNKLKRLVVDYDDYSAEYTNAKEWENVTLSFASTIHKLQGSEYPFVIMVLNMGHYTLLQRNLIYTGITRARKHMILIASTRALDMAIKTNQVARRNTFLSEKIRTEVRLYREAGGFHG